MNGKRNLTVLVAGFILIVAGALFLAVNIGGLSLPWSMMTFSHLVLPDRPMESPMLNAKASATTPPCRQRGPEVVERRPGSASSSSASERLAPQIKRLAYFLNPRRGSNDYSSRSGVKIRPRLDCMAQIICGGKGKEGYPIVRRGTDGTRYHKAHGKRKL